MTKERPILFSAPMVRAILEGRKTQTRRIVKPQPCIIDGVFMHHVAGPKWESGLPYRCAYGKPGDRLWVRETWTGTWHDTAVHLVYAADGSERMAGEAPTEYVLPKAAAKIGNWVTPLFMPRWASRITLEVTKVRVQRLQEISEEDARAEGVELLSDAPACLTPWKNYRLKPGAPFAMNHSIAAASFMSLWDSINGDKSSNANPWVWAVSFKPVGAQR
ncbi:MAG TPA: hypothetical protein VN517_03790 [Terriglobales bacterium]|nr:hypothetical protein [Terriglobales bacterium]